MKKKFRFTYSCLGEENFKKPESDITALEISLFFSVEKKFKVLLVVWQMESGQGHYHRVTCEFNYHGILVGSKEMGREGRNPSN